MASNRGRKNNYDLKVKSRFKEIKSWLEDGYTERSIAQSLGIAYSSFNKYKSDHSELMELIKDGRNDGVVPRLEGAMKEAAFGGTKIVKKAVKKKTVEYNKDGKRSKEYEEIVMVDEEVYIPPNTTAGIFLLTNYSKKYAKDKRMYEQRKKEFEHKVKQDTKDDF